MENISNNWIFCNFYYKKIAQQCGTGREINSACVCPSGFTGDSCENDESMSYICLLFIFLKKLDN